MSKISVNIKGLSLQEFSKGITPLEIMNEAKGVPKDSIICKVDGLLTDLSAQLSNDCELQFMDAQSKEGHSVLLHSTAHLMAQAVKRLFPKTKVTIGPYLENRFYYDFDVKTPFTEEDLLKIEDEMTKISEENLQITHEIKSRDDSISYFEKINENYKVEIINDLDPNETLKVYSQGEFTDLCRGPHVPFTGVIKHFKLLSSSAAYWRGDEKNQTLQRVYGTSFQNIKDLKKYLLMLEEQKKRDHRKIGKELDLFFFDDEVGPGLPLWTPSGTVLIDQLEALAKEKETAGGYLRVRTPHLTKGDFKFIDPLENKYKIDNGAQIIVDNGNAVVGNIYGRKFRVEDKEGRVGVFKIQEHRTSVSALNGKIVAENIVDTVSLDADSIIVLNVEEDAILSAREILFYGSKLTYDCVIKLKQNGSIRFFETFSIQGLSGDAIIELENGKKIRLFDLKTKKIKDLADEFVPHKENYNKDATMVGNGFTITYDMLNNLSKKPTKKSNWKNISQGITLAYCLSPELRKKFPSSKTVFTSVKGDAMIATPPEYYAELLDLNYTTGKDIPGFVKHKLLNEI